VVARDVPHAGIPSPPGEELFRFATVSDIHVGLESFGFLPNVRDPVASPVSPAERCLGAALAEAAAWGAQLVVAKGDITEAGTADQARLAVAILGAAGLPVEALVGNHEVRNGSDDVGPVFAAAGIRLVAGGIGVRDVPGARIVLFDSTRGGRHHGSYAAHADDLVDAAGETADPVIVLTHHHPQPLPLPHHWPPGVPSPEARRVLGRVADANPRVLLSAGHTHRHRRRRYQSVVVTEVGATHDYPGTWAGYVVHEGGIRQVVRRIAAPDALAWTEATGRTVLGLWARWAVGRISDRCFSHTW
jgi:3',5'-cyclic AMP phosphodiesterase CpdA